MLINRRNGLMAGKRLPYDAEVEYLESTGTQWIDAGLICDQNTDIIFSGRTRTVSSATAFFFGARTAFTQRAFAACLVDSSSRTQVGFGSFGGQTYLRGVPSNSDFVISNNGTNWRLSVGEQTSLITAETNDFSTPATLLLFRMSNNGTPDSRSFNGAIYSVKLYHNGVLVRDFIPVRFTNESEQMEGAMYDRLGTGGMNPDGSARTDGLYRNRGTGAFAYGSDKARDASAANGGGV